MGAGDGDAGDGEEAISANNQAASNCTPTSSLAEPGFFRYGVRYSSTLPRLPVQTPLVTPREVYNRAPILTLEAPICEPNIGTTVNR